MSRSPMRIEPLVGASRPATIRSVVVLPHPDGPRRAKNDPRGMSRSMSSTAVKVSKVLVTPQIRRSPAPSVVTISP